MTQQLAYFILEMVHSDWAYHWHFMTNKWVSDNSCKAYNCAGSASLTAKSELMLGPYAK